MNPLRRTGALVATAALAVSGVTLLSSAPAQAAVDPTTPVGQAATWLVAQAKDGLLQSAYSDNYTDPDNPPWVTYDDQGLTIDAVEALAEVGADQTAIDDMTDAVEAQAGMYAGFGNGSVAKLLVLAQTAGRDADTFGSLSTSLPDQLEAAISGGLGTEGRLDGAYGVINSQILATRALDWIGSSKFGDARSFLLRSQCTSGYFQDSFTTPDCVDGTTEPSVDATAYAVVELADVADSTVQAALTKARTWLAAHQESDGSWIDGSLGKSTNSVGLAVRALGPGAAAEKGALWLRAHQARTVGSCTDKLTPVVGALAPGDDAWAAGVASGLPATTTNMSARPLWVRATAQSFPALEYLPAEDGAPTPTAPHGYVRAGTAVAVSVTGATPASAVCLTGGKAPVLRYVGLNGAAAGSVVAPAGTATRSLVATDTGGNTGSTTVRVLDAKTFTVKRSSVKVRKGKRVTVTVLGLAPGERVSIRVRGVVVKTGLADASGSFKRAVLVGKKIGRATLTAQGQFGTRRGATWIKVVR